MRHAADDRLGLSLFRVPAGGQARGVDLKPDMLSIRYPMEVNLHGEAGETLRALLPLLEKKSDRSWQQQVEAWRADWDRTLEERAMAAADPINPQRVAWELSPRLPERAIITSDSGSCANWYARDIRMRRGMMGSLSGGLASMGARGALCHRREVRPSGPPGGGFGRRRRHADEQHGRADYGGQVLEPVAEPPVDLLRVQQPRPQPGDPGSV